jgi:2'-5' RNA ligase
MQNHRTFHFTRSSACLQKAGLSPRHDTHTLAAQEHDPQTWHQGRERYAVWVIELAPQEGAAQAAISQRIHAVRQRLAPWIWWGQRQAHITLQVCGFVSSTNLAQAGHRNDDYLPAWRQAQHAALVALAPQRFTLHIGEPDSFDSAAFLQVFDPQSALPAIRQALALPHAEFRQGDWVPHITLGLYRQAWPKADVAAALSQTLPEHNARLPLTVKALTLVDYEARSLSGPLRSLWRHPLAG